VDGKAETWYKRFTLNNRDIRLPLLGAA
jgi:hypothetical protein